jgi:asparagine synthase (glutamine-hydrolysing)
MNRVVGVIIFNDDHMLLSRVKDCVFQSPHWQADHQANVHTNVAAFSATQRFITPQCSHTLMPYVHESSQCMLVADVFLTNRHALCQLLALSDNVADAMLIMHAYLKWGDACMEHLLGEFMIAL